MSRLAARPGRNGFTLIEVVVSLLLLSLLLAAAWGGIHTAVKAIHSGDQAIERMNRLRVTQQFLRRQISHIMPLAFWRDEFSGKNIMFQGEPDRMRFVALMPGYLSQGGAYVQALALQRSREGLELTFNHAMLNGFSDEDMFSGDDDATLLMGGISRGRFEYRGLDDEGALGDWKDTWEEPDQLPVMVRIDFRMRADSGMSWPVMVIPLMMDVGSLSRAARSRPVPGLQDGVPGMQRMPPGDVGEMRQAQPDERSFRRRR